MPYFKKSFYETIFLSGVCSKLIKAAAHASRSHFYVYALQRRSLAWCRPEWARHIILCGCEIHSYTYSRITIKRTNNINHYYIRIIIIFLNQPTLNRDWRVYLILPKIWGIMHLYPHIITLGEKRFVNYGWNIVLHIFCNII